MDKKHYEQLKAVNEHLALPAPEHYASNDIAVVCGITERRTEELIAHMHNMRKDDNNLKSTNTREKLLLCSKICKTPGELVFLAYKTGEFDLLSNPVQLMRSMSDMSNIQGMSPEERAKFTEQIAERGMSHGN